MSKPEERVTQIIDEKIGLIVAGRETLESVINEYPDLAELLKEDLETALVISAYKSSVEPSENFVRQSKTRLLKRIAQQDNQKISRWSVFPFFSLNRAVMGALVAIFIFLMGAGAVTYAAGLTNPGDTLYPVKRGVEKFSTSIQTDRAQRGELELEYASRRLAEIENLTNRGDYALLGTAFLDYDQSVNLAVSDLQQTNDNQAVSKLELAQKLDQKLDEHQAKLAALKAKLPAQAQDGIDRAIEVSGRGLTVAQLAVQGIHNKTATPTPTATNTPTPTMTPSVTPTPTPTLTVTEDGTPGQSNGRGRPTAYPTRNPHYGTPFPPNKTPRPNQGDEKTARPSPDNPGQPDQPVKTPNH